MFTVATRRLRHICNHPTDLVLMIEITAWLGLAWFILKFLPFQQTSILLQPKVHKREYALSQVEIAKLSRLINVVSRHLPWRSVCFHQGIAAQRILCRLGITANLHYGVLKQGDSLIGHVWVTAQGDVVVGGEGVRSCIRFVTFSPLK